MAKSARKKYKCQVNWPQRATDSTDRTQLILSSEHPTSTRK